MLPNNWILDIPQNQGLNQAKIEPILNYLFPEERRNDRKGIRSDSLVIIKNGRLVYERYANGFGPESKHYLWSVSKSVFSLLVGAAEQEGFLKRSDRVSMYLKDLPIDKAALTIENLLFWTSGIDWQETYEFAPLYSDVVAMLYTRGFKDMGDYVMNLGSRFTPGKHFSYSSGDTELLARVLHAAVPQQDLFVKNFFESVGLSDFTFEKDGSGALVSASGLFLSSRDLARIGQFVLDSLKGEGTKRLTLLPKDWMSSMLRPSAAILTTAKEQERHHGKRTRDYGGGHWWINYLGPQVKAPLRWKDAPADTFMAMGHWGQYLVVIPSLNLVVVRLGDERDSAIFDKNLFLRLLVASVESQ